MRAKLTVVAGLVATGFGYVIATGLVPARDAAVSLGLILWLMSGVCFVRLRRLIRKRFPAVWAEHGTPLFVPILDPRRWSRASTDFWWSGYRALCDSDVDQAMWVFRVSFGSLLLIALGLLLSLFMGA